MKDEYTKFEEEAKRLGSGTNTKGVSDEENQYFSRASKRISYKVEESRRIFNEIRRYALLGITAVEMYKKVKHNPEAERKFLSQLKFALERLVQENPELGTKIPAAFKSETLRQIPISQ
ncbi:MAG: hypothetical protein WC584_00590 [Candidatus Pacearchaeota archaeon]